jgi:hypothetical protein
MELNEWEMIFASEKLLLRRLAVKVFNDLKQTSKTTTMERSIQRSESSSVDVKKKKKSRVVVEGCAGGGGGACFTQQRNGATKTGKRCSFEGCTNNRVQGGVCITHGAIRKRCSYEGCTNGCVKDGVCVTHGAARKRKYAALRDVTSIP